MLVSREQREGEGVSSFVSGIKSEGKISSVRWRPNDPSRAIYSQLSFAAVTADSNHNQISIYECSRSPLAPSVPHLTPSLLFSCAHEGQGTGLAFAGHNTILTSSSSGHLHCYSISDESLKLSGSIQAHKFKSSSASCNSVSVQKNQSIPKVLTSGDDGTIKLFNLADIQTETLNKDPLLEINQYTSIRYASFIDSNQIIACIGALIKIWDLRDYRTVSQIIEWQSSVNHCCLNESRPHLLVSGDSSGGVVNWDLRNTSNPFVEGRKVHQGNVWEVCFHPEDNNKILSCSEDSSVGFSDFGPSKQTDIFRHILGSQHSINTLDIVEDILVCGTDNSSILVKYLPA